MSLYCWIAFSAEAVKKSLSPHVWANPETILPRQPFHTDSHTNPTLKHVDSFTNIFKSACLSLIVPSLWFELPCVPVSLPWDQLWAHLPQSVIIYHTSVCMYTHTHTHARINIRIFIWKWQLDSLFLSPAGQKQKKIAVVQPEKQ